MAIPTIDRNNLYFFHNVYGEAQTLIDSAPDHVYCQPIGWDEDTELERNGLCEALASDGEDTGGYYVTMPDVLFWRPEFTLTETDDDGDEITITTPAHWSPLADQELKDKTWDEIEAAIDAVIAADAAE